MGIEPPKPRRWIAETRLGRYAVTGWWCVARIPRVKNQICSCKEKKNVDFFLANNSWRGIIMIFSSPWRGLCTFWRGIANLARICTFWRDETGPGEEKFGVAPCRCVPARKITEFFLASIPYRHRHRQTAEAQNPLLPAQII